jgi:hypothetical protein
MLFIVMLDVFDKVKCAASPSIHCAIVADDFQILAWGKGQQLVKDFAKCHLAAMKGFVEARLPVSVKKQARLDSDESTAQKLLRLVPSLAKARTTSTRNLGYDFSLKNNRRTAVFEARLCKVANKILKVKALRKIGVRTERFAVACISSATCYGAACLGASPSQIKKRRAISHTTTTIRCAGRSATFDIALTEGNAYVNDPGYRLTCDPIFYLASALWDNAASLDFAHLDTRLQKCV